MGVTDIVTFIGKDKGEMKDQVRKGGPGKPEDDGNDAWSDGKTIS